MRTPVTAFTKSVRAVALFPCLLAALAAETALAGFDSTSPDSATGGGSSAPFFEPALPDSTPFRGFPRASALLDLVALSPQGRFSNYAGTGLGILCSLRGTFDRNGTIGMRVDLGLLNYGVETTTLDLGRVRYDVQTENNIYFFTLGPQVEVGGSDVRLYGNGFVGLSYFVTESKLGDLVDAPYSTNYDDLVPAYGFGGGLLLKLGKGHDPVLLNVGVRYQMHPTTRYLTKGGIVDTPDGTYVLPVKSRTDMLLFQIGIGVGGSR